MNGYSQLGLSFVHVTEAAAIAASAWVGSGNKHDADGAATDAMRTLLNQMPIRGKVVIGEGELDEAPMLYIGEELGTGEGPELDIAVDPLEGTLLVANGQNNAITVLAAAERGKLLHAPDMYMEKLAVGPSAAGYINIDAPLEDNVRRAAFASGKELREMTVMIQNRPRHHQVIQQLRTLGVKVLLFEEGDVSCSIATAVADQRIDVFYGIGGAPEGVVSAVALKCLGGELQGRLLPENNEQAARCIAMGIHQPSQPLMMSDMVRTEQCLFVATGITDSYILKGIHREVSGAYQTHSMLALGGSNEVYMISRTIQPSDKKMLQPKLSYA